MAPNPFDYFTIQNTIAAYCIALDTKDFDKLLEIFAPDVEAVFPVLGREPIKDARTLASTIERRLAPVVTHHSLSTQTIVIAEDGSTAEAVTYFTGAHWGINEHEGQRFDAYGSYKDSLKVVPGEDLAGASGRWVIVKRELHITKKEGNKDIMGN